MKIITIPHPTLREKAKAVVTVDKKLKRFIADLEKTLIEAKNPQGVGLAATQVDAHQRIFSTNLDRQLRSFINPEIITHSEQLVFGPDGKDDYLEGCLSIPGVYGPVPRYQWLELRYQAISNNNTLITHQEKFHDFNARVVQHELDHLNGVLFIDYTLKLELPLYQENKSTKKLEAIDTAPFQYV